MREAGHRAACCTIPFTVRAHPKAGSGGAADSGQGRWGVTAGGCGVSFGGDENVELESSDHYIILWKPEKP